MKQAKYLFDIRAMIALALALLFAEMALAEPGVKQAAGDEQVLKSKSISHAYFDLNRVSCGMTNNGAIVDAKVTNSAALEWPKGSGKALDYASGLWLAGIGHDDETIHTACVEYSSELVPGPVGGDSEDLAYRIYKISRDGSGDWGDWPVEQGAPVDENGDPAILGDQTLWWVCNDGNAPQHSSVFGTAPMNVDFQLTVFGYDRDGPLGDAMFIRWTIINKGTQQFDSCFVGLWDDPDLGDASDDLVGCDTSLSLGYCYNGHSLDAVYGYSLPALGFDFLQGPEVPSGSGNYLPMTSFVWWYNGAPEPLCDPEFPSETYWFLNGYLGDGTPYIDHLGQETQFCFSGDPVIGEGFLDGEWVHPGDRRYLMSSGPFDLAPGDTQVVVGAKVIAQGASRLGAITALRSADNFIQSAYDFDFVDLPHDLKVEVNYPNASQAQICIRVGLQSTTQALADFYDRNGQFVAAVRLFDDGIHNDLYPDDGIWGNRLKIERQGSALSMDLTESHAFFGDRIWPKIETNITVAGQVIVSDISVGLDHINSDGLVNPGEIIRYTVGVQNKTDFDFQDLACEQYCVLEEMFFEDLLIPNGNQVFPELKAGQILTCLYNPDSTYYQFALADNAPEDDCVHVILRLTDNRSNIWLDTVAISVSPIEYVPQYSFMELISGATEGRLKYMISDPPNLTGHHYELSFHEDMDEVRFDLRDVTLGSTLISDHEFPDIYGLNCVSTDGFRVMSGTAEDSAYAYDWDWSPSESRWLSWYNWGGDIFGGGVGLGRDFFESTLHEWEYKDIRIDFDPTGALATNCKVYRRDLGYTVQSGLGTFDGAAYDVSNPDHPRRLNIVFVENNTEQNLADMIWDPNDSDTGGREYLFIMNSDYDPIAAGGYGDDDPLWGPGADVLFGLWTRLRGTHSFLESPAEFTLYVNSNMVHPGDTFGFAPAWTGLNGEGEGKGQKPESFLLSQNYPNPFNPVTMVRYVLPQASRVQLTIYNVAGQRVALLVDEHQQAGQYRVRWDGTKYASGIYFCRLQTDDITKTRKMVLLK